MIGPDAVVVIEVFGSEPGEYDVLAFESVTLQGGALEIRFAEGFEPDDGAEFSFFDWGTRAGTFERVALPELAPGRSWDTEALYQSGRVSTVPEPGAIASALAMAVALAGTRRRRRT